MNTLTARPAISPEMAEALLSLPTPAEQSALLDAHHLLHREGLSSLVEYAAQLARSHPGHARHLADLCIAIATSAAIADVIPQAHYIKAQTHTLAGEFDAALDLIQLAREGFMATGQELPALRTTLGLIHVLGELGQYQDALEAGQTALDKIGRSDEPALAALVAPLQQNMGLCYRRLGRHEEALQAYEAAEARYLALNMAEKASDISNNRGVLFWELGRGSEALAALEKALSTWRQAGLSLLEAQSLSNIGSAHLLLGNYSQSLEALEQARRLLASLEAPVDQHILLLDTANAYLTLNLYPEALAAYQEANRLLEEMGASHHRARALWGLAATLIAQQHLAEAEQVLAEAVALLETTDDTAGPLLGTILLEQAALQAARKEHEAALATARRALGLVTGHDWPVPAIYAHLRLADLALGDLAQAESHLLAAQQLLEPLELPHLHFRLRQRLGRLRRRQGREQEAQILLETAVAEVERLRGTLAQETIRTSFLHDKVSVFDELIQLYLAREDEEYWRRAFVVAEQSRSRTLVDLISGVIKAETSPALATEEWANLRKRRADLNAIYNELLDSGVNSERQSRRKELQARAAELERAISQQQLRATPSPLVGDTLAEPLPPETLWARLPSDVTLLSYYILEDEVLAFVSRSGRLRVVRHLCRAAEVEPLLRRLSIQWDRFRAGSGFTGKHMVVLERSAQHVLQSLYRLLMAPLASILTETADTPPPPQAHKLTIVPHGLLHQVPFHALFDGREYLIEQFEIAYAPSATIFALCQQRPLAPGGRALVLGVPDPSIPAVAAEVEAVASHLPGAQVYFDDQATLAALEAGAAGCALLHLACHGVFRADNPLFSALKLYDGWLMAADAMRLKLPGALVTLSACESGRSHVVGGDEIIGLPRAFLGAGAAAVVVTLWLVQDETTAALMADWYERLRHSDSGPAATLRAAQLALKAAYPHPYYWAPFVLVGRR